MKRKPEAGRTPPFWVVRKMKPGLGAFHGPMFRHSSLNDAMEEANRLAGRFPGSQFVVLKAVTFAYVAEAQAAPAEIAA